MLEDLRNHDAAPNAREREWMQVNPFAVLLRVLVLAGIAVAIGVSASPPAPAGATTVAEAP